MGYRGILPPTFAKEDFSRAENLNDLNEGSPLQDLYEARQGKTGFIYDKSFQPLLSAAAASNTCHPGSPEISIFLKRE